MSFKAVIHAPANLEDLQEIYKNINQLRAEKTTKYLAALGVTHGTLKDILQQEKIHSTAFKVS